MNQRIFVAILLSVGAAALADDAPEPEKPAKSIRHEEKYLNLVEATKAFEMAKETKKRVLVYQDWPSWLSCQKFEGRVLLDDHVVEFINKHFVPVITDHPKGDTEPKRNPDVWARVEKWKEAPNNSQLVWLVSADESKRDGIYYHKYDEPEKLLEWMESIVKKDHGE